MSATRFGVKIVLKKGIMHGWRLASVAACATAKCAAIYTQLWIRIQYMFFRKEYNVYWLTIKALYANKSV